MNAKQGQSALFGDWSVGHIAVPELERVTKEEEDEERHRWKVHWKCGEK
jgi:hypothetical protein